MTVVELVRHAKAGTRGEWDAGPDRERPLSPVGHEQARALADELSVGAPITALHTSPLVRCRQTLEPLAHALDLALLEEEALAEASRVPVVDAGSLWVASAWLAGAAAALLDRLVAAHPGGRIVCCSHGDVLPALLALLAGREGLDVADTHLPKGARATLTFAGGRCVDLARVDAPPIPSGRLPAGAGEVGA